LCDLTRRERWHFGKGDEPEALLGNVRIMCQTIHLSYVHHVHCLDVVREVPVAEEVFNLVFELRKTEDTLRQP
jgi:hypothetical protein